MRFGTSRFWNLWEFFCKRSWAWEKWRMVENPFTRCNLIVSKKRNDAVYITVITCIVFKFFEYNNIHTVQKLSSLTFDCSNSNIACTKYIVT